MIWRLIRWVHVLQEQSSDLRACGRGCGNEQPPLSIRILMVRDPKGSTGRESQQRVPGFRRDPVHLQRQESILGQEQHWEWHLEKRECSLRHMGSGDFLWDSAHIFLILQDLGQNKVERSLKSTQTEADCVVYCLFWSKLQGERWH